MDHKTRVWNALHFKDVDRVPFDMFDEAGYLFDGEGRYDPGQRCFLSLEQQVEARARFHLEFDTDLIFDTPVIAAGSTAYSMQLCGESATRYDLLSATFPTIAQVWHPWPPHLAVKPGVHPGPEEYVDLLVRWQNGIELPLKLELKSGTLAGYDVLMDTLEEWPCWQEILTPDLDAFDYTYVEQLRNRTKDDVALYGTIVGPFGMYSLLLGTEKAAYLLVDQPEMVNKMLSWLTDVTIESGRDLIRHGIDILRVGEAGTSLLSKGIYHNFVAAHHRRLSEALCSAGGVPVIHICGTCKRLLDSLAEAGVVALETLTPPPLGDIELSEAKARIGDRVCLKGNLDPVHVVASLKREEVAQKAFQTLETGEKEGGFIFSVADCLVPGTPKENLQAISDVLHSSYRSD